MKHSKNFGKRTVCSVLAAVISVSMMQSVLAVEYDISVGDIHVEDGESGALSWQDNNETYNEGNKYDHAAENDNEIHVTQSDADPSTEEKESTENTITVGDNVEDVTITLENVNIEVAEDDFGAAVSVGENSDITIELDGKNTLEGGIGGAGLNIGKDSTVTIQDENETEGSLKAIAGDPSAAGIGSNGSLNPLDKQEGGNVTINSGTVTGIGGGQGAGIGGGRESDFGDITINGGNVTGKFDDDVEAWGAAGIGTGSNGTAGTININGGTVDGTGSYGGAGIGAGLNGTVDEIKITESGTDDTVVIAQGGSTGAGIGAGQGANGIMIPEAKSEVGIITIEGGEIDATGGDYAAGIGTGWSNQTLQDTVTASVGEIDISGGNIKASGGSYGAGIGTGYYAGAKVGKIEITGGKIEKAQGGNYGAGIGSSTYADVETINISKQADVNAQGGIYSAAIGAGWSGKYGAINITGGDIVANSGYSSSAIGNAYQGKGGTIAIQGVNSLIALGDKYFAIDSDNSDVTGVAQTILNGMFKETIGTESNGLTKAEDVTFVIIDEQGNEIKNFSLKIQHQSSANMYESFAVNLPEGGRYYVFCEDNYNLSVAGHDSEEGKKIAYVISENDMLNANLMQFPRYDVDYEFVSGTAGQTLPPEILNQLQENVNGQTLTLKDFQAMLAGNYVPDGFNPVEVEGGTWSFAQWTMSDILNGDGMLQNATMTGTWTFTPDTPDPVVPTPTDPETPDGPDDPGETIPDEPTPLEDIPDAPTPLADIPETPVPLAEQPDGLVDILDEDVPLAGEANTGNHDALWYLLAALSTVGLGSLKFWEKKKLLRK